MANGERRTGRSSRATRAAWRRNLVDSFTRLELVVPAAVLTAPVGLQMMFQAPSACLDRAGAFPHRRPHQGFGLSEEGARPEHRVAGRYACSA